MRSIRLLLACVLLVLGAHVQHGVACGMSWQKPRSHFDGVSSQGFVWITEDLGEAETSKPFKLPLYAIFDSDDEQSSPYVGYGWRIPLLESNITQIDERTFRMERPDGWYILFHRDKAGSTILNGDSGWKAEIQGDTITAVAECGTRLVYQKGRLTTMTLKDQTFDFVFEGDRVAEIKEGSLSIVQVLKAPDGQVTGLRLRDNRTTTLERGPRPRVQVVSGQNVVGGMGASLSKVTLGEGAAAKARTMEYALDEKRNPTLKIGERVLAWNAETKRVIRDGEWTYEVTAGARSMDNAAIGRMNGKKQSEYWYRNELKGEEIAQGLDGVKKITTWFTNGKLAGNIRKVEQVANGKVTILRQLSWEESGRLIREIGPDGKAETFTYDEKGNRFSSKDAPPAPEALKAAENALKELLEKETNPVAKQKLMYNLANFYIGDSRDFAKARSVAPLITNPARRFTIILHSYDYDQTLSPQDKIRHYQELLQQYPEQRKRLEGLIEIRKKAADEN